MAASGRPVELRPARPDVADLVLLLDDGRQDAYTGMHVQAEVVAILWLPLDDDRQADTGAALKLVKLASLLTHAT